jgi:tripartite-type tricarboxylate transporter receptor subunit TctC
MAESGYPGFDVSTWYGLMGPAGLPREIVNRLNAEVNKALAASDVRERLSRLALEPGPMSAEQFTQFMRTDQAKWAKIIKEASITADP